MVFLEAGLPHVNQTAYWRSVSCVDAIFTIQEVIAQASLWRARARCRCVCMTCSEYSNQHIILYY